MPHSPPFDGSDRAGLGVLAYAYGVVTAIGLAATVATGYLLVRGPFLGETLLDPIPMLVALCGFVVAIVVLTWGRRAPRAWGPDPLRTRPSTRFRSR